jgi:hypothetical protein
VYAYRIACVPRLWGFDHVQSCLVACLLGGWLAGSIRSIYLSCNRLGPKKKKNRPNKVSLPLLNTQRPTRLDGQAAFYMFVYTLLAYVAISLHMTMVKQFGSVAAVLVGNARKSMTIVLSFLFFPKPFSILYIWGGALVFGGLTVSAYLKSQGKGGSSSKGGGGGSAVVSAVTASGLPIKA